jgi:hypothetical protein
MSQAPSPALVELGLFDTLRASAAARVAANGAVGATRGAATGAFSSAAEEALDPDTWKHGLAHGLMSVATAATTGGVSGGLMGGVLDGARVAKGRAGVDFVDERMLTRVSDSGVKMMDGRLSAEWLETVRAREPNPPTLEFGDHRVRIYGNATPEEVKAIRAAYQKLWDRKFNAALPDEVVIRDFAWESTGSSSGPTVMVVRHQLRGPGGQGLLLHEAGHTWDFGVAGSVAPDWGTGPAWSDYGLTTRWEDYAEAFRVLHESWDMFRGMDVLEELTNTNARMRKIAFILLSRIPDPP